MTKPLDAEQAEIDRIWQETCSDFRLYAERCLKIQTMNGELVPFIFNEVQTLLEDIIRDIKSDGRRVRLYVLKARREGVSTWFTGRCFWKTANNKNIYTLLVTHEPEATDFLFKMQKRYYDKLPPEYKPSTSFNNAKMLVFNTPEGTGLDSAIRVGTAGKGDLGSGQLIHNLHLSEIAKYALHIQESLMNSLLQTVPKDDNSEVVLESTARGLGGEFHKGFFKSRVFYDAVMVDGRPAIRKRVNENASKDNDYSSIFLPWFIFSTYRLPVPAGFKRTKEEQAMVSLYNLTDEQLIWRRNTIENECRSNANTFKQEYPSNPQEAFIASGTPAFPNEKVLQFMKDAPKPIARYECLASAHGSGQFIARDDGRFMVWVEPRPGRPYVISADVAEGLRHGDFSAFSVWDHISSEEVAHWHGHMAAFDFASLLYWVGMRYNEAWLVPERNAIGQSTVERLLDLEYKNIYVETIPDPPHKPRKRYGWLTIHGKTASLILENLIYEVNTGTHGIKCKETFEEMFNFKIQDDGKVESDPGTFDDRVMETAIGKYVLQKLPKIRVYNMADRIRGRGTKSGVPPSKAWT